MRVAIIGAGVSGLTCAHELERHGIYPTIFEKNNFIGEQISHVSALLNAVHRPVRDPLKYIGKEFGLDIKPLNTVKTLIHHSPSRNVVMKGNFGYLLARGREENDIKRQIHSKLRNPNIILNKVPDHEALMEEYDYIVAANASPDIALELGCWQSTLDGFERGAVVLGQFEPHTMHFWLNKNYCKNGYAIMSSFSDKKAFITLVIPEVDEKTIDHYWELFISTENINYNIVEEFKLEHSSGHVYPHRVGNLFLAGNAGGALDSAFGFGIFDSIVMGVMAARAIACGTDYEGAVKGVVQRNRYMYQIRKYFNRTDNKGYDKLISAVGLHGFRYVLYNGPFNAFKVGGRLAAHLEKRNK